MLKSQESQGTVLTLAIPRRTSGPITDDYFLTATVFNSVHPQGMSTNLLVHVAALASPQIQSPLLLDDSF